MAFSNGFENSQPDNGPRSRDSAHSNRHSLFSFFEEQQSAANTPLTRPSSFGISQPSTNTYTDARGNLQRRFTTTNAPNLFGSLSPIAQQRRQAAEFSPPDLSFAIKSQQGQRADRMSAERDFLRLKQMEFESAQNEIALLELQIQQRKEALRRDQADFRGPAGHQSEPTTPPEYRESGFPTSLSKPNRFSASNLASPPGIINRPSRAGSQAMSPPSDQRAAAYQALTGSMPQTRDNSDEGEDEHTEDMWERGHRSSKSLNRDSMPVTRRDHTRGGFADFASAFGPVNTTAFLFDDENDKNVAGSTTASNRSSFVRSGILQANTNEDQFPILLRRGTDGKMIPTSSGGADEGQSGTSNNVPTTRTRPLSYSQGVKMPSRSATSTVESPTFRPVQPTASGSVTPTRSNRHSMGPRIGTYPENTQRPSLMASPGAAAENTRAAPRLQSSYSTNDIPTVNNPAGAAQQGGNVTSPEERLHNHNASLGRIPTGAIRSNRTSRDLTELTRSPEMRMPELRNEDAITPSIQSVLQQSAAPNATVSQAASGVNTMTAGAGPFPQHAYNGFGANAAFYGGYTLPGHPSAPQAHGLNGMNGMNSLVNGLNGMAIGGAGQWNGPLPQQNMFGGNLFNGYNPYGAQQGHFNQSAQGRTGGFQPRRTAGEEQARFQNLPLETLQGEIYTLCRDQHGCRYLQKKLEEARPDQTNLIFNEVNAYMYELMTDPFGNYLVQKLLEQCTEEQRTALIENASGEMINIALNQHGTRALQKMIDFVSTPAQVQRVIQSLSTNVVSLIQDLNGNHVIQKCLNRLSSVDAQFIFDSVAQECVRVGTHRHGCCVIQRCIDHAEGAQKANLVLAIVKRADQLVGDPFGNYVLQYIFEQGEDTFSTPLCNQFKGSMAEYSKQKFSSNVVEKAIRIADDATKQDLIHELVHSPNFESVADDAFGNYVLQTAWDYAKGDDEHALVDKIRPLLARGMRSKPHGRRFASRLTEYDQRNGNSAQSTAATNAPSTQSFVASMPAVGFAAPGQQATGFGAQHGFGQTGNMFPTPPTSSHGNGMNGTTTSAYGGYAGSNGFNQSYNANAQFSAPAQQAFPYYGQNAHQQQQQGSQFN